MFGLIICNFVIILICYFLMAILEWSEFKSHYFGPDGAYHVQSNLQEPWRARQDIFQVGLKCSLLCLWLLNYWGKKSVARKFLDLFLPSVKMLATKDWGEKNVKCFFFFKWEKKLCVKSYGGKSGEFILGCFISRGNFYFSSMCATELKVLEGIIKKKFVGLCSKNNSNHYFIFSHLVPQKKKSKSFHKKITQ